jgi:predicted DCC family thiol-disulfide oxidoreductase YuxK
MSGNYLLYDGDCPLCSRFVAMTRLRETLPGFHLIDARDDPQLVALHRSEGREINDGMILAVGDAFHHGADALSGIAGITTSSSLFNRANAVLFRSAPVARAVYPSMRAGRNLLLRLLRREMIA